MESTEIYTLFADGIIRDSKNQKIDINTIKNTLKHINIAAEVESIDKRAFEGCRSLESVRFEEGSQLKSIGKNAFNACRALKTIEIPASVEVIDECAFYECESLESISFAEGSKLKSIDREAFADCYALKTIEIPASVERISNDAFCFSVYLKNISFAPDSKLKSIGKYAFSHCQSLKSITLPLTFMGKDNNYWSSLGVDTNTTDIICSDELYNKLGETDLNIQVINELIDKIVPDENILKIYISKLDDIESEITKQKIAQSLLERVPEKDQIEYFKALYNDANISSELKVMLTKIIKNNIFINKHEAVNKVTEKFLDASIQQGELDTVEKLYELGVAFDNIFDKYEKEFNKQSPTNKSYKNLYISEQRQGEKEQEDDGPQLHVLLPFARGLSGVITDNTCKATKEMQLALNSNNEDSIINEMNSLSEELRKLHDIIRQENGEVSQSIGQLQDQVEEYRSTQFYNTRTPILAEEIKSLGEFPQDIKKLLSAEAGSNLYSMVLCPQVQDPYLRSNKLAVCSFKRQKYLRRGYIEQDRQNSPFSTSLNEQLKDVKPTKKETPKETIKKAAELHMHEYENISVDSRLIMALTQEQDLQSATNEGIKQCSVDLESADKIKSLGEFMQLASRYGAGRLPQVFLNNRNEAIEKIKKKINETQEGLKNNKPIDIDKIAKEQMQTIMAVKEAYKTYMNIDENEATRRFEAVFSNETGIDLTDMDGILNTLHSTVEDWYFYSPYEPFYSPINNLKQDESIGEAAAAKLDIAIQFFIGKLNIFCVANKLTTANFGELLDNNEPLRNECISLIKEGLKKGDSIQKTICDFVIDNKDTFQTDVIDSIGLDEVVKSFNEQYTIIEKSKDRSDQEMDEFFMYENVDNPVMVKYGNNICFAYSQLSQYSNTYTDDKVFHKCREEAFARACTLVDDNLTLPKYTLDSVLNLSAQDRKSINKYRALNLDQATINLLRSLTRLPASVREKCKLLQNIGQTVNEMKYEDHERFMNQLGVNENIAYLNLFDSTHTIKYAEKNNIDVKRLIPERSKSKFSAADVLDNLDLQISDKRFSNLNTAEKDNRKDRVIENKKGNR